MKKAADKLRKHLARVKRDLQDPQKVLHYEAGLWRRAAMLPQQIELLKQAQQVTYKDMLFEFTI